MILKMGNYINAPPASETDTIILKYFKHVKTEKLFTCVQEYIDDY